MVRALIVGLGLIALGACGAGQPAQAPAPTPAEATLLGYAASDFRDHVAPAGASFQHVYGGSLSGEHGVARAILCGEFRAAASDPWTTFATIETDPYENWIGGVAESQCNNPRAALDTARDLADALTQRYREGA